ncbi:unnamed protein product [Caenorhabditis angaria]|uniref:Secreted protein n=1 Tax=Caenorhabditis angaria TaxID=860376 RepID=A0A9P1N133_9PELO|nr:unnamed protein product [Caenorhabditis angaria]
MKFLFLIATCILELAQAELDTYQAKFVGYTLLRDFQVSNVTLDDLDMVFQFPFSISSCENAETKSETKSEMYERQYKNRRSSIPSKDIANHFGYRKGYAEKDRNPTFARFVIKEEVLTRFVHEVEIGSDGWNFKMIFTYPTQRDEMEVVRAVGKDGVESFYLKSLKICNNENS